MDISPKALYNSLRMSFQENPTFSVERWKVEDYRQISLDELFSRLKEFGLDFDRHSFLGFADEYDSPEELFDHFVADLELESEDQDKLYLVIFELWRRLACEKASISIICDELDYQIFLYDQGKVESNEALDDALSSFHEALEENVDQGLSRDEVFEAVSEYLANDFQAFMIDYISDLIEHHDNAYAEELLEQFYSFMPEKKWFDLLQARLVGAKDIRKGHELLAKLFLHESQTPDLQFNFDVLSYLVTLPDLELFRHVAIRTLPLLQEEEEFLELIHLSCDVFQSLDMPEKAASLERIYERRKAHNVSDEDFTFFESLLK